MNITELRIGRNVGARPMMSTAWDSFIAESRDVLSKFAEDIAANEYWLEVHTGIGCYDGATEESAVITLYWTPEGFTNVERDNYSYTNLDDAVIRLAGLYRQSTIAVVHGGRSVLLGETRTAPRAVRDTDTCRDEWWYGEVK